MIIENSKDGFKKKVNSKLKKNVQRRMSVDYYANFFKVSKTENQNHYIHNLNQIGLSNPDSIKSRLPSGAEANLGIFEQLVYPKSRYVEGSVPTMCFLPSFEIFN